VNDDCAEGKEAVLSFLERAAQNILANLVFYRVVRDDAGNLVAIDCREQLFIGSGSYSIEGNRVASRRLVINVQQKQQTESPVGPSIMPLWRQVWKGL